MKWLMLLLFCACSLVQEKQPQQMLTCQSPCRGEEECSAKLYIDETFVKTYEAFPLGERNDCVEHAVIVVHGADRVGKNYFRRITKYAVDKEELGEKVQVIAPSFKIKEDNPEPNEAYWSYQGWRLGYQFDAGIKAYAGFDFIDKMVEKLSDRKLYPNLKRIVVTGHSAGGQTVQRYALLSSAKPRSGVKIRYMPSNPSSYAYLNDLRPLPNGDFDYPVERINGWAKIKNGWPSISGCAYTFNEYKYGIEDQPAYGLQIPLQGMVDRYIKREVVYFLGEADTDEDDPMLAKSCDAMLQGKHRFDRGTKFFQYVNKYYPSNNHSMVTVPDVGHSSYLMYKSQQGRDLLFR